MDEVHPSSILSLFPKAYAEKVRHGCFALGFGRVMLNMVNWSPPGSVRRYNTSGHPNGLASKHVSKLEAIFKNQFHRL